MPRRLIAFVLAVAVSITLLVWQRPRPDPVVPPGPVPTWTSLIDSITQDKVTTHLMTLCTDTAGRMSGMAGNRQSADYIEGVFRASGLTVRRQRFSVPRVNESHEKSTGESENVIGEAGDGPVALVLGAHLDHIGYGPQMSRAPGERKVHPGADDNASGVSALLEAARVSGVMKPPTRVAFVAFSGEELGLIGSKAYVRQVTGVRLMVNMDMVGRGAVPQALVRNQTVGAYATSAARQLGLGVRLGRDSGGSDHEAFAAAGVPTIFLSTGGHADYHTPRDVPDKIDRAGVVAAAKLVAQIAHDFR